jgi:putative exosortase-associated protein (TIGR04073 family)
MKKVLLAVALLFVLSAVTLAQQAPATPPVTEGPQYTIFTKLFRGIGNVIISPFEIPVSAYNVAADTDVFVGATAGSVAGLAAGAERLGAGAFDIVTFLFPPYDRPLVKYEVGKSDATNAAVGAFPKEF